MSSTSKDERCEISVPPPVATIGDRLVSMDDWWARNRARNIRIIPLFDLRPSNLFDKRRLAHSNLVVVSIPLEYLKKRSFELPNRHLEFSILLEESGLEEALTFFLGQKFHDRKRPGKPWKVTDILVDHPALWKQAEDLGLSFEGENDPPFPLPRLWKPNPMVENVLLKCLQNRPSHGSLQVWDLASGAGRDVAFLAEQLLAADNAYEVWGWDHRYNETESKITRSFWDRRGVGHLTKSFKINLSSWDAVTSLLPIDLVAAIFCVRFWKYNLVASLAQCPKITPGTLFGLSHFCKLYNGAPWTFDYPSEKTVLERTQLHDIFHQQGWEILHDEIVLDSDHGRTMIEFVARKS